MPFWQFFRSRLIGWIGHALLVQSSKTAYRIMLLFYILINFFTYTTIISISSFRFKKCVLQTLWPWIIFHLFFFYKNFFDTLVFCHTNSCVRGKEFLIKSNGTKKLPWKKVHVHCITLSSSASSLFMRTGAPQIREQMSGSEIS